MGGSSIGIKILAILYLGVFIADRIGRSFNKLLTTGLWILELPESIPGVEPLGQILSYSSIVIFSLSLKSLKSCLNFFSIFMIQVRFLPGVIFNWTILLQSEKARFTPLRYFSLSVITTILPLSVFEL